MSEHPPGAGETVPGRRAGPAEFAVPAGLLVLGVVTVWQARGIASGASGAAIGPRVFPYAVGVLLLFCAVVAAIALVRQGGAVAEAGEDVDSEAGTDWPTVGRLAAAFLALVVLVEPLGWPIGAMLLFGGTAWALGARPITRPLVIGAVLGLATHLLFTRFLGLYLPAGPLEVVLGG